jgi:hypothetical protein
MVENAKCCRIIKYISQKSLKCILVPSYNYKMSIAINLHILILERDQVFIKGKHYDREKNVLQNTNYMHLVKFQSNCSSNLLVRREYFFKLTLIR